MVLNFTNRKVVCVRKGVQWRTEKCTGSSPILAPLYCYYYPYSTYTIMSPAELKSARVITFWKFGGKKRFMIAFTNVPSKKKKKPCSYPQKCPSHVCSHNTVYSRCHCFSPFYPHRLFLQTNIISVPVAEIHLLFQITSVDVPGCKSVVPVRRTSPLLWSEWVNQSISARLRPAAAVSPLSHATTPQCQ